MLDRSLGGTRRRRTRPRASIAGPLSLCATCRTSIARLSGGDCCAEVWVVGHVWSVELQRLLGKVEHLVAGVLDDLARAPSLHDVDRTAADYRAGQEVRHDREVVVLVQR